MSMDQILAVINQECLPVAAIVQNSTFSTIVNRETPGVVASLQNGMFRMSG